MHAVFGGVEARRGRPIRLGLGVVPGAAADFVSPVDGDAPNQQGDATNAENRKCLASDRSLNSLHPTFSAITSLSIKTLAFRVDIVTVT